MDLKLNNKLFVVCGASGGLGRAIAETLLIEGAKIIAVARNIDRLSDLENSSTKVEAIQGDLSEETTHLKILAQIGERAIDGIVVNSGGPPAIPVMETTLEDWDNAYKGVVRWKIGLTQALLPKMIEQGFGRVLFIESVATKQPVENLVLSNAMRLAVTGYVKTLSQEIGGSGVTLNILGPGYHDTERLQQIFTKTSKLKGVPEEEIRSNFKKQTAVKEIGDPKDFASMAVWLLSSYSGYITGQTLTVDGGLVKGIMG